MKVTVILDERESELLEELADLEHRTPRQQLLVLALKGLAEREAELIERLEARRPAAA